MEAAVFHLKNILIVGDNPQLTHVLSEGCRRIGLYPRTADDMPTAIARIYSREPDIVCVDAEMQNGVALELCGLLSSTSQGQEIPVIVVTGRDFLEAVRACGELCVYYVRKSDALWTSIRAVIYELVDIEPVASHHLLGWDEVS